jgi:chromosome segregation ATPase
VKETEFASAHDTQSILRKTIDVQKQQFALCQINLDVAAKELELANKKIAANEDGKDISTLPVKIEESVEYTSLKNTHVEQIKGLIQKNGQKMAGLNKKLTDTKKENEELRKANEEAKTSYEQELNNQKNYTSQFENEIRDIKHKLSKTMEERDRMATNVQHFKQTLSSSSNSEGHLKMEVENLTKTLNDERAKTEEFTTKLKEKDINANRDLKTQAAMFEGDIAKLKGQIVDLNLDGDQLKSEVETLQSDILTKEIKIQNMATQREKQNKAMERWSHEHAYAEDMILQTVPKVVESLNGAKQARPNSQTWPNKETLNKLGYRDKLKVFQDVLLSTTTQLTKLEAEAVEHQYKEKIPPLSFHEKNTKKAEM